MNGTLNIDLYRVVWNTRTGRRGVAQKIRRSPSGRLRVDVAWDDGLSSWCSPLFLSPEPVAAAAS